MNIILQEEQRHSAISDLVGYVSNSVTHQPIRHQWAVSLLTCRWERTGTIAVTVGRSFGGEGDRQ